jgi:hypothetical protein
MGIRAKIQNLYYRQKNISTISLYSESTMDSIEESHERKYNQRKPKVNTKEQNFKMQNDGVLLCQVANITASIYAQPQSRSG